MLQTGLGVDHRVENSQLSAAGGGRRASGPAPAAAGPIPGPTRPVAPTGAAR
jgi:hypothetical protein